MPVPIVLRPNRAALEDPAEMQRRYERKGIVFCGLVVNEAKKIAGLIKVPSEGLTYVKTKVRYTFDNWRSEKIVETDMQTKIDSGVLAFSIGRFEIYWPKLTRDNRRNVVMFSVSCELHGQILEDDNNGMYYMINQRFPSKRTLDEEFDDATKRVFIKAMVYRKYEPYGSPMLRRAVNAEVQTEQSIPCNESIKSPDKITENTNTPACYKHLKTFLKNIESKIPGETIFNGDIEKMKKEFNEICGNIEAYNNETEDVVIPEFEEAKEGQTSSATVKMHRRKGFFRKLSSLRFFKRK